jgi:hypothetical protein
VSPAGRGRRGAGVWTVSIQTRTGLSETDAVNRAISVYGFIDDQLAQGNELILRRSDTGQEQLVRFL